MSNKYVLTEQRHPEYAYLRRIRALKTFTTIDGVEIRKGSLGGWLESEDNLSQEGRCWVRNEACVFGMARVSDEALVSGEAVVAGESAVSEKAWICERARVYGEVQISGEAFISGTAWVTGESKVYGEAQIGGEAEVTGKAAVYGGAVIKGQTFVSAGHISEPGHVRCLTGLQFPVTIVPGYIHISGICMSNRQWDKMSLKRMIEMGLRADDYNLLRKLIPVLAIPAPRRTK